MVAESGQGNVKLGLRGTSSSSCVWLCTIEFLLLFIIVVVVRSIWLFLIHYINVSVVYNRYSVNTRIDTDSQ